MRTVKVAALQMSMSTEVSANIATAERLVRSAAKQGAQIILIPELFEGHYFCKDQTTDLNRAIEMSSHPTVAHFAKVAKELGVVLPISVYERANNSLFNSVAIV
ncbi:MAG: nitrilase-related carbon-nitrogen hydrolase, partial [Acidimicrobiaceae bacterium]